MTCAALGRLSLGGLVAIAGCAGGDRSGTSGTIVVEQALMIRESGDSVRFGDATSVRSSSGDGFLVAPILGPRLVAAYAADGSLQYLLGGRGKGPGEFGDISGAGWGPGDSVYAGDFSGRRISVFAPRTGAFVRSFPAPDALSSFRTTPQGRLSMPAYTRDGGRQPMMRTGWTSGVDSFVTSWPMERVGAVAPDPSGDLWIADRLTYTISLYRRNEVLRTIRREVDWFPADTSPVTGPAWVGKGRPFIASLDIDQDGRLWVLIKRKNPRWTGQATPLRPGQALTGFPPLDEIFEGVVDVFDARSGAFLASTIVPGDFLHFVGPGLVSQKVREDSSGGIVIPVWRLHVR